MQQMVGASTLDGSWDFKERWMSRKPAGLLEDMRTVGVDPQEGNSRSQRRSLEGS